VQACPKNTSKWQLDIKFSTLGFLNVKNKKKICDSLMPNKQTAGGGGSGGGKENFS
jgi:hypothetical protein